jgi:uncharacterized protein (TIGR02246 family)
MTADEAIDALHEQWTAAVRAGDVDALLQLLTPDYVLWSPGAPPIVGPDEVRPLFEAAFEAYDIEPDFELEERLISGDLAVERGWDVQTIHPGDGGPPRTRRQRAMLVLRCDADGAWRFARGMSQAGPPA